MLSGEHWFEHFNPYHMVTSSHSHTCPLTDTHQHIANYNPTATLNPTVTLCNACLLMLSFSHSHCFTLLLALTHYCLNTQIAFTLLWMPNWSACILCLSMLPLPIVHTLNISRFLISEDRYLLPQQASSQLRAPQEAPWHYLHAQGVTILTPHWAQGWAPECVIYQALAWTWAGYTWVMEPEKIPAWAGSRPA